MKGGIGLASAIRTLTILPCPGRESTRQSTALFWFPLVGAILGGLSLLLAMALVALDGALLAGALVTAVLAWLTRGFHLDGVADMADGFGGGFTKERTLAIMKDSHVGSFGVIALVVLLLTKATAISLLCMQGQQRMLFILLVPLFSRMFLALQASVNPYGRPEGGTASALVTQARPWMGLVTVGVSLGIVYLLIPAQLVVPVSLVLGVGALTCLVIAVYSRKRLGGVTGDILGATCEWCETLMFAAAVVA